MKGSVATASPEESHDIFLTRARLNLEIEIEERLFDRSRLLDKKSRDLEQARIEAEILKKKLELLNVDDNRLRKVFIENGKEKESLLEAEYEALNKSYQQKLKSIKKEDQEKWKKSDDGKKFVLDQIKVIRSNLQQKFEEKSQQISVLESELQSPESLLVREGVSLANRIFEITSVIDWLSDPKNIEAKIANTEWYRKDTPILEMDDLRKQFLSGFNNLVEELKSDSEKLKEFAKRNSISDDELAGNFFDNFSISDFQRTEDGQKLIKALVNQKIVSLEQEKQQSSVRKKEIIADLANRSSESYPIVWTMPGKTRKYGGDIDDFRYGSKKPAKEVYKPYTQIHRALMDANWAIRDGKDDLKPNYITAHILFVVSDSPHKSEYQGGRTYIDFPINTQWQGEWNDEVLNSSKTLERAENQKAPSGEHSEKALEIFLKNQKNVENIVKILKAKLLEKFNQNNGFKIYEVNLFLNSNKNICYNCEQILSGIESSQSDQSFLKLLKLELQKQGLKVLTKSNEQFPRMVISVSAYELFNWNDRMQREARNPIKQQQYEEGFSSTRINTKPLSGKVILSSDEISLHPDFEYTKKFGETETYVSARKARAEETLERDGAPFYSGFSSAGGSVNLLGSSRRAKYQPPQSFDGVSNVPKTLPKVTSSAQLSDEEEICNAKS